MRAHAPRPADARGAEPAHRRGCTRSPASARSTRRSSGSSRASSSSGSDGSRDRRRSGTGTCSAATPAASAPEAAPPEADTTPAASCTAATRRSRARASPSSRRRSRGSAPLVDRSTDSRAPRADRAPRAAAPRAAPRPPARRDTPRAPGLARHDLDQLRALVERRRGVVAGDPGREAVAYEARVHRPAALLAVVVRARAARQEAEPVAHPGELRPERVGHAGLEPADHPGAPAAEQHAALPRLAQDRVEAVDAPDRERVRRVPARDVDRVLRRARARAGRRAATG